MPPILALAGEVLAIAAAAGATLVVGLLGLASVSQLLKQWFGWRPRDLRGTGGREITPPDAAPRRRERPGRSSSAGVRRARADGTHS
jgi:hypothetical protein